jgi:hypothetical protein
MSQAFIQPRLHALLDSSVGSKNEKHCRFTSDQEQGSDGSDEPKRLPRNKHSRLDRLGSLFARRDQGSFPGSRHGSCAPVRNQKPRLGQNLSADHIRRTDFPLIVADGNVLSDGRSVVVGRCPKDRAVPWARGRERLLRRSTRPWRSSTAWIVLLAGSLMSVKRRSSRSRILRAPQLGCSCFTLRM